MDVLEGFYILSDVLLHFAFMDYVSISKLDLIFWFIVAFGFSLYSCKDKHILFKILSCVFLLLGQDLI